MSHIELRGNKQRQAAVAMDLDSPVDADHQDIISIVDGDQALPDQVKSFPDW
jgi:hypothetical protein